MTDFSLVLKHWKADTWKTTSYHAWKFFTHCTVL